MTFWNGFTIIFWKYTIKKYEKKNKLIDIFSDEIQFYKTIYTIL
jgi:hypothetical protein